MPGSEAIGPNTYVVSPLESPPEVTHEPDSSRGCTWAFNRLVAHCCQKRSDSETNSQDERYQENYSLPYLSTSDQIHPMESIPITEKPISEVVTVSSVIEASPSPTPETHDGLTPMYGWGIPVERTNSTNLVTQLLGLSRKNVIGEGATGKVFLYKDSETNIKFAVKEILKKEERAFSPCKGEACGLLIPAHSNIARTLALIIFDNEKQRYSVIKDINEVSGSGHNNLSVMFVISEYVDGEELFELINRLETVERLELASAVAKQIGSALQHLHSHGFIYRDTKPENIIVLINAVKGLYSAQLVDFGMVKAIPKEWGKLTACGSPAYISPEIVKGIRGHRYPPPIFYDVNSDMFGLGVTIVATVTCCSLCDLWCRYHGQHPPESWRNYDVRYNLKFAEIPAEDKKSLFYQEVPQLRQDHYASLIGLMTSLTEEQPEDRMISIDI